MNARTIKSVLDVFDIHSILLLTILPVLGWTWRRILPEYLHEFFGIIQPSDDDEILPAPPRRDEPVLCSNCPGTQIESGTVHLLSSLGLQVIDMAGTLAIFFLLGVSPVFAEGVMSPLFLYCSPTLIKPDSPPKK